MLTVTTNLQISRVFYIFLTFPVGCGVCCCGASHSVTETNGAAIGDMRFPWRRDRRRELAEPAWLLKLPHRYGVPQCFQVQLAKARYKAGPYSGAGKSPPAERQWAGGLTHLLGRGRHTFSVPLVFSTRPHSVPCGAFLPKYNFICLTDNYLSLASKIC